MSYEGRHWGCGHDRKECDGHCQDICARCGQGKANHDNNIEILCRGFVTNIPATEQLANIYDFLSEIDDLSTCEVMESLLDEGIDIDDFKKRTQKLIDKFARVRRQ